jgi:hypothetical protein
MHQNKQLTLRRELQTAGPALRPTCRYRSGRERRSVERRRKEAIKKAKMWITIILFDSDI